MSLAITIIGNSIFHIKLKMIVVGGFITAIKSFGIHVHRSYFACHNYSIKILKCCLKTLKCFKLILLSNLFTVDNACLHLVCPSNGLYSPLLE